MDTAKGLIAGTEREGIVVAFVMYTQSGGRESIENIPRSVVKISGQKTNVNIQLNQRALADLKVSEGDSLILYFDPALGHVGMRRPGTNDPAGAHRKVLPRATKRDGTPSGSARVQITGMVKFFRIDYGKAAGVYNLVYDQPSGLWVFALPKGSWER